VTTGARRLPSALTSYKESGENKEIPAHGVDLGWVNEREEKIDERADRPLNRRETPMRQLRCCATSSLRLTVPRSVIRISMPGPVRAARGSGRSSSASHAPYADRRFTSSERLTGVAGAGTLDTSRPEKCR